MRRTLAVAVLALWALAGLPAPASAGGPTSVLITEPSAGQATALYAGSAEYGDLERLLTPSPEATEAPPVSGGTRYTMTWMAHDVSPWRIQTVHIAGDGTASVSTHDLLGSGQVGPEGAWRAITDGEELASLMDRLFTGEPSAAVSPQAAGQAPAAAPAAPAPPETERFSLTGWRWAVPGVLGGLLIALVGSRRRTPAEPHHVLIDKEPEHART